MDDVVPTNAENLSVPLAGQQFSWPRPIAHAISRAVLLGMAVVLPPVLTVVILLWAINTVRQYLLTPVEDSVREFLVWRNADIYREPRGHESREPTLNVNGKNYRRLAGPEKIPGEYIPAEVYNWLKTNRPTISYPRLARSHIANTFKHGTCIRASWCRFSCACSRVVCTS